MHSLTDHGNALRFVDAYGKTFRYSAAQGWLAYNDLFWEQSPEAAMRAAAITAQSIMDETDTQGITDDTAKKIMKWAHSSLSGPHMREILKIAQNHEIICRRTMQMDSNPWLLNTPNCTVDLQTGEALNHDPKHLITQMTNASYDPEAECPRWLKFLDDITGGSPDLSFTLQQAAGYALTGDVSERCIFILYGTGSNGKSCYIDTLHHMLGTYARVAPAETFASKFNNTSPNALAGLKGKRLVLASETDQGCSLSESLVKSMSGDQTITARLLYHEFFEFKPTFKVFLSTNHKPTIRGGDKAIWKRIRLIPFAITIPDDKQIPNLVQQLIEEESGILNWALEGLSAWLAMDKHMKVCEEAVLATEEYHREEDILAQFIEACVIEDPGGQTPNTTLYETYKKWADSNGLRPLSHKTLTPLLKEKGMTQGRNTTTRYWMNIRIMGSFGVSSYDATDNEF